MKQRTHLSCEAVLEALALEPNTRKATLEKYLRNYPQFAEAILDFSIENERGEAVRQGPLTTRELGLVDTGWKNHLKAAPKPLADPFAFLSGVELVAIAALLQVPKQVLTALRDRTVVVTSIPKRFAIRLATELRSDFDALMAFLSTPPVLSLHRSRKSEAKPRISECKTFEQVLKDAGVAYELRNQLMAED